jgi:hypothetical protein
MGGGGQHKNYGIDKDHVINCIFKNKKKHWEHAEEQNP